MSRFILKDFPHWINEQNLISFFSDFGIITDIKILKNETGTSRNICFLGFSKKIDFVYLKSVLKDNFLGKIAISVGKNLTLEDTVIRAGESLQSISSRKFILLIKNIAFTASYQDVETLLKSFGHFFFLEFKSYGEKESRLYYAKISYAFPESTVRAACNLDGKIFHGRILRILKMQSATHKIHATQNSFSFTNFKNLSAREKKEKSNCTEQSWFNIFIPKEKLVQSIIAKFGVPRLHGRHSTDVNHKMFINFMPEARIQNEALYFLKKEGFVFNWKVFGKFVKKSKKKIFLQNFPIIDLVSLKIFFQKFGKVENVSLFLSIGLVIVEYYQKKDAKKAFQSVEKFCIGKTKIVLGWIPIKTNKHQEIFNKTKGRAQQGENSQTFSNENRLENQEQKKMAKKRGLGTKKVTWLEKRKTGTKISRSAGRCTPKKKKVSGKILIRNLPFNSSFDDLQKNFNPIAPILSIRMPKKNSTQIKGYAFVEFRSIEEAKKVILLTQKSHFFSRHLSMSLLL
jgi:RNA recognition motif-containing protein|mmetsp:Transcript_4146/g.9876  ORF Transcript_4146/g.9876 Transcript_4146/m.9876 type:complete len:513 (+) Transcript_4146:89-1627(+)